MINVIKEDVTINDIINKPIKELIQYVFINDEGIVLMIIQIGTGEQAFWSLIDVVNHADVISDKNKYADRVRNYLLENNFKIHNADIVIK